MTDKPAISVFLYDNANGLYTPLEALLIDIDRIIREDDIDWGMDYGWEGVRN